MSRLKKKWPTGTDDIRMRREVQTGEGREAEGKERKSSQNMKIMKPHSQVWRER